MWMISLKSLTKISSLYSIHFENLSMATYTYQKPPGAPTVVIYFSRTSHAEITVDVVTPSVLHSESLAKTCHEHHT